SVELVVTCHPFGKSASSLILEDNKVLDKIEKPAPVEDAFEHDPQLGHLGVGQCLAGDRTPRFEPLPAGRQRSDALLDAIGARQQLVEDEKGRYLRFVGLDLVERRPDGGILISSVLELDDRKRQAVNEENN